MLKKAMYTLFAIILLAAMVGTCIQSYRLELYRQQSEYYRTELESAHSRQSELADAVDECFQSVVRTREVLSSTVNTVGDLRNQLREVRAEFENMENRLCDFYDNYNNRSSNNNTEIKGE